EAALKDAARRLSDVGWSVEEIGDTPSLHEAAELQERLWLGDGFATLADAAAREGDKGALAVGAAFRAKAETLPADVVSQTLLRRATRPREGGLFLEKPPVLLLPVSAELPFPDGLDLEGEAGFERVWRAQLPQRALPVVGLPCLTVATGLAGSIPVGVQVV